MEDLTKLSASAIAAAIHDRRASSAEFVEAHLQRIADVNPQINAVVQLDERALDNARLADEALLRGDDVGPLHGVPFTAKDWLETEGVVCTGGFVESAGRIAKRDATVAARMRSAGAILLGKTNVRADNPVHGPTRNPYDLERTPGGSSSGEAAIIAGGGSPLGLGSDSGGSIRFPAHCCGIAALKPTNGRVPNTGHFPRISAMNDPRTQIGPMARSVQDLALALPVIEGPDFMDASVVPMPVGDFTAVDVAGLRVARYVNDGFANPSADTVRAVHDAGQAIEEAGASVEEAAPPRIEEAISITRVYWARRESMSVSEWLPPSPGTLSGDEVDRGLFEWDRLKREMLWFLRRFDVIICPVAETAAGPHRVESERDFIYMLPYSLTGWPVAVVRAGTSDDGMPIGVQVIAHPWRDDVALAVAARIEAALGGWQAPPL